MQGETYVSCLYFFNGVFIALGLGMMGMAGYLFYEFYALETGLRALPYLWLIPGFLMCMIAGIGCCGARKQKHAIDKSGCNFFLYLYYVIVLILFLVQIAQCIYLFVVLGYVEEANLKIDTSPVEQGELFFNKQITSAISANEHTQELWYGVETMFTCCGYYEYNDEYAFGTCPEGSTDGCQAELYAFIQQNGIICMAISGTIAFVEFLALIAACCLCMCKPKFSNENAQYQPYAA